MILKSQVEWSFGIISNLKKQDLLNKQIASIHALNISNYEILVAAPFQPNNESVTWLPFNESEKPDWITKKKNVLAKNAKYENLVLCHDYIGFHPNWAAGFDFFGLDWNIALTRVDDIKGRRFYDWLAWDSPNYERYSPIPYSVKNHTSFQFIPGAYWVAKKSFMIENPLNENLVWGQSEDVEWSLRVRDKGLVFNPYSRVRHLKKHRGYKCHRSIYNRGLEFRPRPEYLEWEPL